MEDLKDTKTNEQEFNTGDAGNKNIILYTAHCPKCNILEKKLISKNINFKINEDLEEMINKGFTSAPMLEVDGEIYDYKQAVNWVNSMEANL